jgi:hypothetical protein
VDESTEKITPLDVRHDAKFRDRRITFGSQKLQPSMRPLLVVVLHVGPQNPIQVPWAEDQQPVQAVSAQRLHPAFGEGVRVRCPDRRADHPDPLACEHVIEGALALRVTAPIVDHNYVVAGILLSLAFYAAASVLLFKLLSSDFTPETTFWTVLFLAVSPASFFFQAVYTESLFLLATVACFYCARQHRWAFAGLAGMASTLTRSSGLVLIVPLVVLVHAAA